MRVPLFARLLVSSAPDRFAAPTHLPERNLDVLRSAAVLSVLLDHLLGIWDRHLPFITNWELGRLGVLLFFVHTSLVLMSSLERQGFRKDWVWAFYVRRAFRIYPLAIATILVVVLAGIPPHVLPGPIPNRPVDATIPTLLTNLALVQNLFGRPDLLGVLWSLPLEVQMYLILPVAFLLARRSVNAVIVMGAGLGVAGLSVEYAHIPGIWRLSVASFGPCFMAGVLAYALLRLRRQSLIAAPMWGLILASCVPLFTMFKPNAATPERGWLFCLAVGVAIPCVRELGSSVVTRTAHAVCTYSYGVYLLHIPAMWLSFFVLGSIPLWAQWVAFSALIVALPVLAYRLIELPGIRFGKWMAGRRIAVAAPVGAT